MALRVLLADESSTIKKVISLALQDFAVEVKVVHSGVDVVEVAKQFNPDIIFADVLLQKKNGYEVCFDLKSDVLLSKIPVVLMWSSFMDLDENAYRSSNANAKLEKPFEVEDLRKLVTQLATKTKENPASAFLKFPSAMSDPMKAEAREKNISQPPKVQAPVPEPSLSRLQNPVAPPAARSPSGPPPQPVNPNHNWNMDSFEDIQIFTDEEEPANSTNTSPNKSVENFSEMRLKPLPEKKELDSDENWKQKDLSQFKIDVADEDEGPFAMMDLSKLDPVAAKPKKPEPKAPGKGPESFASFDFSDSDSEPMNLELDDVVHETQVREPAKQETSDWNFKLPEHEVSQIRGNTVELPTDYLDALNEEITKPPVEFKAPTPAPVPRPAPTAVPSQAAAPKPTMAASPVMPVIDNAMIEKIVREQTRELVEKLVNKLVPDMAKQLIQNELDRLLNEENNP